MARIAVIDDDTLMRDLVGTSLTRLQHKVQLASSGNAFLQTFSPDCFDLVITDLKMPGISGIELAAELLKREKKLSVILMTAHGTVDSAVKAMKLGVQDFIEKPFQIESLEHVVKRVLEVKGLKNENEKLRKSLSEHYKFIGESSVIKELLSVVDEIAASKSTVLIEGESGTGKELVAHATHLKSLRYDGPFIKINCAAIPENLIESELFGHEKGAYTGAAKLRIGKFEDANGGTILLDEIGEMPLPIQSKLLRVLQEREVSRVGSNASIPLDVRVICTTNRDLKKEIEQGAFREDLFYRLNVIPLTIPPLREHKEDIPLLCGHFIRKYNLENGFSVSGIHPDALSKLSEHDWPGNVRELENVIQRAVVFSKFEIITEKYLKFFEQKSSSEAIELYPSMTIAQGEKQLILKTLKSCNNNRSKSADLLGISVRTLRNKLNEYKI